MKKIYFDNGSTSFPKAPGVAERVADILTHGSYNINRGGYEASYSLSDEILATREKLCRLFGDLCHELGLGRRVYADLLFDHNALGEVFGELGTGRQDELAQHIQHGQRLNADGLRVLFQQDLLAGTDLDRRIDAMAGEQL